MTTIRFPWHRIAWCVPFLLASLVAVPADAIKGCKAKTASDGSIRISFKGLKGTPVWGVEEGVEDTQFANLLSCVDTTTREGRNCLTFAKGTVEGRTPPESCMLYLTDESAKTCSVWIRGCTPGVRAESERSVKAWASIAADGSVLDCLNCEPLGTSQTGTGVYTVDFSPEFTDITGRPKTATIDSFSTGSTVGMVSLSAHPSDTASIVVRTQNQDGDPNNRGFTVIIY